MWHLSDDQSPASEAALDRAWRHHSSSDTYGATAHHAQDPAEIMMILEEHDPAEHALRERAALRSEIFAGFAEYLFADGPGPYAVRDRIEGFLLSFQPDLAERCPLPEEWVSPAEVTAVLRKRKYVARLAASRSAATSSAALSTWYRAFSAEPDAECVVHTIAGLIALIVSEGESWRLMVAVAYGIAKIFHPDLIAGMSLHDIAILSGDSGRATPCARIQRIYSRRLAAAGARACLAPYQKSAAAASTYSAAQMGNTNRAAKLRRHHC